MPFISRRALAFVLGMLMLTLSGCGVTRLAYNHADNYFVGTVQDYFDPAPEQLRAVRANAGQLLDWHRRHELPLYVAMFEQAAQKTRDGLTEPEVNWALAQLHQRYDTLAQRIIEANAPLLARLSARNLAALEHKFAAENTKLEREYVGADRTRRDERRVKRVQTQLERWIGPLRADQRAIVAAWVAGAPNASIDWYQEHVARQRNLLAALRSEHNPAALAARLSGLWLDRGTSNERRAREDSRMAALILSIDRTLSAAQRGRAVRRMQQLAGDFRGLLQ
jgi:Family of unknown function (DUF6279)